MIPDRTLLGLSRTSHIENWCGILRDTRGHNMTRVAEGPDSRVVGFANAGRARPTNLPYDGEVYTLYVVPDHQGAGHGRRLLGALLSALWAAGCRSALVWVLAGNPARFFYEAMGGTLIATREEPFHGVVLSECAYGWPRPRPPRRDAHVGLRQQRLSENGMLATRLRCAVRLAEQGQQDLAELTGTETEREAGQSATGRRAGGTA